MRGLFSHVWGIFLRLVLSPHQKYIKITAFHLLGLKSPPRRRLTNTNIDIHISIGITISINSSTHPSNPKPIIRHHPHPTNIITILRSLWRNCIHFVCYTCRTKLTRRFVTDFWLVFWKTWCGYIGCPKIELFEGNCGLVFDCF